MDALALAKKAYEDYLNGTEPVTDTMRRVARVFLMLSVALSKVTELQIKKVDSVADSMARIHDYMQVLNEGIAAAGTDAKGNAPVTLFEGATQKDAEDYMNAVLDAAGVTDRSKFAVNPNLNPNNKYDFTVSLDQANALSKSLQVAIDDYSSASQKEQLALQNLMSRYNAAVEATTAAIQKSGTQAQAALRPMGAV